MANLKNYIVLSVFFILIIVGQYFYMSYRSNEIYSQLEQEKKTKQRVIDSLQVVKNQTITNLINENETIKQESQYWYDLAKKKSINPDYNFDFITAAGIISNSKYQPGR